MHRSVLRRPLQMQKLALTFIYRAMAYFTPSKIVKLQKLHTARKRLKKRTAAMESGTSLNDNIIGAEGIAFGADFSACGHTSNRKLLELGDLTDHLLRERGVRNSHIRKPAEGNHLDRHRSAVADRVQRL